MAVSHKGAQPNDNQLGKDHQAHQKNQGHGSSCLTCLD